MTRFSPIVVSVAALVSAALEAAPAAGAGLELTGRPGDAGEMVFEGVGGLPGLPVELWINDDWRGGVWCDETGAFGFPPVAVAEGDVAVATASLGIHPGDPEVWRAVRGALRGQDTGVVVQPDAAGVAVVDLAVPVPHPGVLRVLEFTALAEAGVTDVQVSWDVTASGGGAGHVRFVPMRDGADMQTHVLPLDIAATGAATGWTEDGPRTGLRFSWRGGAMRIGAVRLRESIAFDFRRPGDRCGLTGWNHMEPPTVEAGSLQLELTGVDPWLVHRDEAPLRGAGFVNPAHFNRLEMVGRWDMGAPVTIVELYWRDNLRDGEADGYGVAGNYARTPGPVVLADWPWTGVGFDIGAGRNATWGGEDGPVPLAGLRFDPGALFARPDSGATIELDVVRLSSAAALGPSRPWIVGMGSGDARPAPALPWFEASRRRADEPLVFTADAASQVNGNEVFRLVDTVRAIGRWRDVDKLPDGWGRDRYEGVIRYMAGWFRLFEHGRPCRNYRIDDGGNYHFVPLPGTADVFRDWALDAGLRPMLVVGTPNIPEPLIAGGFTLGEYGYQVRQPTDYGKWRGYMRSLFEWLAAEFGRNEVKTWPIVVGIEADWQAKAVDPETGELLDEEANRREFMKVVDCVRAAAVDALGPTVYVGCYGAHETQADAYVEHWGTGEGFVPGAEPDRMGFFGVSDWYVINIDLKDPFSEAGRARRMNVANAMAPGMVWKVGHITAALDAQPVLRHVEVGLPETGYFDTAGALNADGEAVAADVAYADYRGAALRNLRTIAYAARPRIAWAWNRYALGTGDMGGWFLDTAKAPVFHAMRIQKKLAGERKLPVERSGAERHRGNRVYVAASAADNDEGLHRLLLVNFNEDFDARYEETIALVLTGLGNAEAVELTEYRIGPQENNWWVDWQAWREEAGVPYAAGINQGHLGANVRLRDHYARWHNDIVGTIAPEQKDVWLSRSAEYAARDDLRPTRKPYRVPVIDGRARLTFSLASLDSLYVEAVLAGDRAGAIDFGPPADGLAGWDRQGDWTLEGQARYVARLGGAAVLAATVDRLEPGVAYTLTARSKASGCVVDYGIFLEGSGPRVTAWGDLSAMWNRLAVTARADSEGRLRVGMSAPRQPVEAADRVVFEDIRLRRSR